MLLLQLLAAVFLLFSAFCFFGPQIAIYGPNAIRAMARNRQARGVASTLVMISVLAIFAPYYVPATLDGVGSVTLVALDIFTLDYSLA